VTGMGLRNGSAAYRELGGMLRRLREEAGITGAALAERLDLTPTHVSRMESGKRDSTTTDVVQYVVGCGGTLKTMKPYVELTRLAERKQGYWLTDKRIGNSLQSLIFHEASAIQLFGYDPQLIPGLLQTPDYTSAVIAAAEPDLPEDEVTGMVRTRGERQRILHWNRPAQFSFFVHEQALQLQVGSTTIMHDQLLHLVLTAALDNVDVRIVPSAAGERSVFGGSFRLMEFEERQRPLVYLDHPGGAGLFLEDRRFVKDYYQLLPKLTDVALDEGQSREFAAYLADAYDRGSQPDVAHRVAEEQLQRHGGKRLRGSGVAESPTPIYE
jgi:transcriptional regulator with XRE-family HTH domain